MSMMDPDLFLNLEKFELTLDYINSLNNLNFNLKDHPLFYAIHSKNKELIKTLISSGVSANTSPRERPITPLIFTIEKGGNFEICELLISLGADVNLSQIIGLPIGPPIHHAAKHKELGICKLLIEHGARVDHLNEFDLFYNGSITHLGIFIFLMKNASIEVISKSLNGMKDHELIDTLIEEEQRRFDLRISLLSSREFDEDCFFFKEDFPFDLFKLILKECLLL